MRPNGFDVLREMGHRNLQSLKSFPLSNVTRIRAGKKYGSITIMVDNGTAHALMAGDKVRFMLVIAGEEDFRKVEAELERDGDLQNF